MQKIYTIQTAAEYLKMSVYAVKAHIYREKNLIGRVVGNTLMFTKQELDDFKARKPPREPEELDIFTVQTAAEYLGMVPTALMYHVHKPNPNLTGRKVGNTMLFTKEELDDFQKTRRPPGRPNKWPKAGQPA